MATKKRSADSQDVLPLHNATRRRGPKIQGSQKGYSSVVLSCRVDKQIQEAFTSYQKKLESTCGVRFTRNDVFRHLIEQKLLDEGHLASPVETPGVQSINALLQLQKRVAVLESQRKRAR